MRLVVIGRERRPDNKAVNLLAKCVGAALLIAGLAASGPAIAADPIELKNVPLEVFTQKKPMGAIPLSIPVPVQYEFAKLKGMRWNDMSWMRPEDVEPTNSSGDLPLKSGLMLGKITSDVQYDKTSDLFLGLEDPTSMEQARQVYSDMRIERLDAGGHRVLLIAMNEAKSGKNLYALYVSTGIDTGVVRIFFRPPDNSREIGDFVWAKIKTDLAAGR